MKIQNFDHARKTIEDVTNELNELKLFLEEADRALAVVNALKTGRPIPPRPLISPIFGPALPQAVPPESMVDRVLAIFQENPHRTLMPKEVVGYYKAKGWPHISDPKEFYRAVSGSMAYLTNKKQKLVKTESGYALNQ